MASGSGISNSWIFEQMKIVENAILDYAEDDPDRWEKIATRVGHGKTAEDVEKYFHNLYEDVGGIIAGKFDQYVDSDDKEEKYDKEDEVDTTSPTKTE